MSKEEIILEGKKVDEEFLIQFNSEYNEILRITGEGKIIFNRDDYPELTANDFAKKFVDILEEITLECPKCGHISTK